MRICRIVGAGTPPAFLPAKPGELLIAADAGYRAVRQHGLRPDLVVGDFDSLGEAPQGEHVIRHPVEKDDTDMLLAVRLGLAEGCTHFYLYGGQGGRLDHTLANLQTLAFLAGLQKTAFLIGEAETLTVLKRAALHFPRRESGTVSVFAFGGAAEGVTLTGLHYPLADAHLTPEYPLGVSNCFTGQEAAVSVRQGMLLLLFPGEIDPETLSVLWENG